MKPRTDDRTTSKTNQDKLKAYERVYRELKASIRSQAIRPGESLPISVVARRLDASPTPVREALSRLEQEGLIVTKNGKKTVRILNVDELNQIFDIKKAVESHIGELAIERGNREQRRELALVLASMESFLERDFEDLNREHSSITDWLEIDQRFHGLLYAMAANAMAGDFVAQLNLQWHQHRMGLLTLDGALRRSIAEHIEIARSVLNSDPARTRSLIFDHLEGVRSTLNNVLDAFSFST
jgi:DNA-binding GntR family transcriptional regulator